MDILTVSTMSGVKKLNVVAGGGKVKLVTVDMGAPEFSPEKIKIKELVLLVIMKKI